MPSAVNSNPSSPTSPRDTMIGIPTSSDRGRVESSHSDGIPSADPSAHDAVTPFSAHSVEPEISVPSLVLLILKLRLLPLRADLMRHLFSTGRRRMPMATCARLSRSV